MAFGSLNSSGQSTQSLSEINMVPLIDVMLVLLVIFMITAPLMSHSVVVELPKVSTQPAGEQPDAVDIAVDASGQVFWDDQPVALEEAKTRLGLVADETPQPAVRLRADRETRYEILAEILGAASRSGVDGIGFVTSPTSGGGEAGEAATNTPAAGAPAAGSPTSGASAAGAPAAGTSTGAE